jgi:hypothetical protein
MTAAWVFRPAERDCRQSDCVRPIPCCAGKPDQPIEDSSGGIGREEQEHRGGCGEDDGPPERRWQMGYRGAERNDYQTMEGVNSKRYADAFGAECRKYGDFGA